MTEVHSWLYNWRMVIIVLSVKASQLITRKCTCKFKFILIDININNKPPRMADAKRKAGASFVRGGLIFARVSS